jgi:hypothetical protein
VKSETGPHFADAAGNSEGASRDFDEVQTARRAVSGSTSVHLDRAGISSASSRRSTVSSIGTCVGLPQRDAIGERISSLAPGTGGSIRLRRIRNQSIGGSRLPTRTQAVAWLAAVEREVGWVARLWSCGDHRDRVSLHGPRRAGRRAAAAVAEALGVAPARRAAS